MTSHTTLMILIAGPYRSGTGDDPEKMAQNVHAMEAYALPIFRAGHIPLLGEWLALPLTNLAGSQKVGWTLRRDFPPDCRTPAGPLRRGLARRRGFPGRRSDGGGRPRVRAAGLFQAQ